MLGYSLCSDGDWEGGRVGTRVGQELGITVSDGEPDGAIEGWALDVGLAELKTVGDKLSGLVG